MWVVVVVVIEYEGIMGVVCIDLYQYFWCYCVVDYLWIGFGMGVFVCDYLFDVLWLQMYVQVFGVLIVVQVCVGCDEMVFLFDFVCDDVCIVVVVGWEDFGVLVLVDCVVEWCSLKLCGFCYQVQDEVDVGVFVVDFGFNCGVVWLQVNGYVYDVFVFECQLLDVCVFCVWYDVYWFVFDYCGKLVFVVFECDDMVFLCWCVVLCELGVLLYVVCKLLGFVIEVDWWCGLCGQDIWYVEQCFDVVFDVFGLQWLMFGLDWFVCLFVVLYDEVVLFVECWVELWLLVVECDVLWGGMVVCCYVVLGDMKCGI